MNYSGGSGRTRASVTSIRSTVDGVATSVTRATVPTTSARPPSAAVIVMVMGWPGMTW